MKYADIDDFKIVSVRDEEKHIGFIICDRNEERVSDKFFNVASDAIIYLEDNREKLSLIK